MASFSRLIRFESPDGRSFYADLKHEPFQLPLPGTTTDAYESFEDLITGKDPVEAIFHSVSPPFIDYDRSYLILVIQLLLPLPRDDLPIHCVGLNYKSHAEEANVSLIRGSLIFFLVRKKEKADPENRS